MVIVSLFHTIYVVDFFYNEDWYTRTIDISHDHFGWMLAWGDVTFLPCLYTLQTQYLARYPTYLSQTQSLGLLAFGLLGYYIFRSANYERDYVRSNNGECNIWESQQHSSDVSIRPAMEKHITACSLLPVGGAKQDTQTILPI